MKLLFDLAATQPSRMAKRHGGGIYGEIVLRKIIERGLPVACIYKSKAYLNPEIAELLKQCKIPICDSSEDINKFIEKESVDRVYSPFPRTFKNSIKVPFYGTIHGLRALETPLDKNAFKYRNVSFIEMAKLLTKSILPKLGYKKTYNYFNSILKDANFHPIVVSNHTAHSILSYFPFTKGQEIPVFYSPATTSKEELQRVYSERYYLIVSANRWEKNALRAIMAIDSLIQNGLINNVKVFVTGADSSRLYKYSIVNKDAFVFKGYVSDSELRQLYHDAYCLLYPSLNEGFGYPPIESMRYGVPVISSPFTSLCEVCGDAALFFNPFSIHELMNRILQMENEDVHKVYSIRGQKRFSQIIERQNNDLENLVNYLYDEV